MNYLINQCTTLQRDSNRNLDWNSLVLNRTILRDDYRMNRDVRKHTFIRAIIGMLPIGILAALIFLDEKQSGNSGMAINTPLFLAFITLMLFGIFMVIEMVRFFVLGRTKYAVANLGVITCIGAFFILASYLDHLVN